MMLAEQIRDSLPDVRIMTNYGGGNFKRQLSRADKNGARIALILGEDEIANGTVTVKELATGEQQTLAQSGLSARLSELLG